MTFSYLSAIIPLVVVEGMMFRFETVEEYGSTVEEFQGSIDPATEYVIYSEYSYENYDGQAIVIFERDGRLFEVNGSHCSCYGLEGQWDVEATTLAALLMRFEPDGSHYFSSYGVDGAAVYARLKEYEAYLASKDNEEAKAQVDKLLTALKTQPLTDVFYL